MQLLVVSVRFQYFYGIFSGVLIWCFFFRFTEEEIDVVSVGDKTLPTNPTAKDRRALQTTVAHKISARIVTPTTATTKPIVPSSAPGGGGIKTIPPRRRPSAGDDLHYQRPSNTLTVKYATIPAQNTAESVSRKRPHTTVVRGQDAKRYRTVGLNGTTVATTSTVGKKLARSPLKRPHEDVDDDCSDANAADESDTIEKRNLHNDMERQRRIGLKNLFEELKYQIPDLKNKERAPKVYILREAALLCSRYQKEEDERSALKQKQIALYARVSQLRTTVSLLRSGALSSN